MTRLAEQQSEFANALLDAALPTPLGVVGPDGDPSPRRFSVYRNNVVVGLTEVLKDAFPAVGRLVGVDFFNAMAGAYIRFDPPRSPVLLEYGGGFPSFIETFKPAASVPYLADVARIEWAWMEAYHAQDASPLAAAAFSGIPTDALPSIRLRLHPSIRVVRSLMPAVTIWRMNIADGVPGPVQFDNLGEDALVIRPAATVEVRSMPAGGADFLAALGEGCSVLDAADSAVAHAPSFNLSVNIAGLIEAGAFVACGLDETAALNNRRAAT
jgi:hypothetical protein